MGSVKFKEGFDFQKILNESLNVFFKDALRVALTNPSQAYHFLRTLRWQKKAAQIRSYEAPLERNLFIVRTNFVGSVVITS